MDRPKLYFADVEKKASIGKKLSVDPSNWPQEILAALFAKYPFLERYPSAFTWDEQNLDEGNATAFVVFRLKPAYSPEEQPYDIKIPVIVKNWRLLDMDVFVRPDGTFWPITERRVVDTVQSLGDITNPNKEGVVSPQEIYVSGLTQQPLLNKTAALKLETLSGTCDEAQIEKLAADIMSEQPYSSINRAAQAALEKLAAMALAIPDADSAAAAVLKPNVFQIIMEKPGSYWVKTAAREAYKPRVVRMTQKDFEKLSLAEREYILKEGSLTYVEEAQIPQESEETVYRPIEKLASIKLVETSYEGEPLLGIAIPMASGGLAWYNDGVCCIDKELWGIKRGDGFSELQKQATQEFVGKGLLVTKSPDGVVGFEADVNSVISNPHETKLIGYVDSRPATVTISPYVSKPIVKEAEYVLPLDTAFLPIRHVITLPKNLDLIQKSATAPDTVTVTKSGSHYSISGKPVECIPEDERVGIDKTQAKFVLGLLGYDELSASEALTKEGSREFPVVYSVGDYQRWRRFVSELQKTAAERVDRVRPYRKELIKAAVRAIQNPDVLEGVLATQLINDRNIDIFIQNIPKMEELLALLSEMLVASRLGLNMSEFSLKTCVSELDNILSELKQIADENRSALKSEEAKGEVGSLMAVATGLGPTQKQIPAVQRTPALEQQPQR